MIYACLIVASERLKPKQLLLAVFVLLFVGGLGRVAANESPALKPELLRLGHDWERVKLEVKDPDDQERQMAILAERAEGITKLNPNASDPTIWLGIIVAEQAVLANENGSPLKALSLARRARSILENAEKIDPATMNAGAPIALGELYNRVPGFPVSFGDKVQARHFFHEAMMNAPNGFDANYFYGTFLFEQGENPEALTVLKHALSLPPLPNLPIWDKSRREVIQQILAKIHSYERN
jgi:cytochrome c-type biogenesis protein CcmH/NrfG